MALSPRVLRIDDVEQMVGVSRRTIYSWIKNDDFPAAINLGPRAVGWPYNEVVSWLKTRMEARSRPSDAGLGDGL